MEEERDKLLKKVLNYISYRARSEKEIVYYLKKKLKKNQPESLIEEVVSKLKEFNLLNDTEFAIQWIRSRLTRGKGSMLIKAELFRKGITKDTIEDQLSQIDSSEWKASAATILRKKLTTWKDYPIRIRKEKAFRLLFSRGFPLNIVKTVIDANIDSE